MGFANIGSDPRDLLAELFCDTRATAHMDGRIVANRTSEPTEHDYALADNVIALLSESVVAPSPDGGAVTAEEAILVTMLNAEIANATIQDVWRAYNEWTRVRVKDTLASSAPTEKGGTE